MIGQKLRQLRLQRKISQRELARQLDVSLRTVKNWEGDISDPNLECFYRIVKLFHTSADELLGIDSSEYLDLSVFEERDRIRIRRALQGFLDADIK